MYATLSQTITKLQRLDINPLCAQSPHKAEKMSS